VSDQGLFPFSRRVGSAMEVPLSFADVERAARVCLGQLVTDSLSVAAASKSETVAPIGRGFRALRVAVEPEVSSARTRSDLVGHVHWHVRRFPRLFPVMEADLVARPLSGERTQPVLEASYRPPGRVLGVVGDVLGRVVARSTAEAFIELLGHTMERAVAGRRCASWSSAYTSREAG